MNAVAWTAGKYNRYGFLPTRVYTWTAVTSAAPPPPPPPPPPAPTIVVPVAPIQVSVAPPPVLTPQILGGLGLRMGPAPVQVGGGVGGMDFAIRDGIRKRKRRRLWAQALAVARGDVQKALKLLAGWSKSS
jgi:hypothetical protein